jgi:hypothetical protein
MPDFIQLEDLQTQIINRERDMKPRNDRMDVWHSTYLLIDEYQLSKPKGIVRFTSNEPRTILDLGVNIMSRHPFKPRIPMTYADKDTEREGIGLLEFGIKGCFRDLDRQMNRRGLPSARKIAAWHLLLRGYAASRFVVRNEKNPLDYEPWDMRFTLPLFDRKGLHSVIYQSVTTWGDILESFPDAAADLVKGAGRLLSQDLGQWVTQYEYWDRYQEAVAVGQPQRRSASDIRNTGRPESWLLWADPPSLHGIQDENDDPTCPVIIVAANGLPLFNTPRRPAATLYEAGPVDLAVKRGALPIWKRQGGWIADQGRSILAAVEDAIPQFNEIVSIIWQIMDNDAFGTWVQRTRAGELRDVTLGGNAINPMKIGESLERVAGMAASPDTYRLLDFLGKQVSQGSLDQNLLRGLENFTGSGFLRSQLENAALNAIGPWLEAYECWATEIAQSLMNQLHHNAGESFTVIAEGSGRRLMKIKFGPEMVKDVVYVEMKAKPALPDDLAVRVNIAAQLLNPARPMASLQTVFDQVLDWEDAEREKKLLFDDVADMDPIVVMLRIQARMVARGMPEIAKLFGDKAFVMAFAQQVMQARLVQQLQGGGQPGGGPPGAPMGGGEEPAMARPEGAPPETAGIEGGRTGVPPAPAGEGGMV